MRPWMRIRGGDGRADALESAGRRAFNAFMLTTAGVGLAAALYYTFFPDAVTTPLNLTLGYIAIAAAGSAPFLIRDGERAWRTRLIILLASFGLICVGAVSAGNYLSVLAGVLPALLLTVTLSFGGVYGAAALVVVCAVFAGVYFTGHTGSADEIGAMYGAFNYIEVCIISCVGALLIWSGASVYQRQMQRAAEELARARAAAEDAAKAKSAFFANVSHEIRTPMNGVLGLAELLKDADLGEREASYAQTIHRSGVALLAILNDILDLSKIEAGKMELAPEPFDFSDAIGDVAALFSQNAAAKGLSLSVDLDPNLPRRCIGDPVRLRQILNNLVGNAVKFTSAGSITIRARLASDTTGGDDLHIEFAVSDTGVGIPEEKRQSIFDEFEQADALTSKTYGGTGLGLAIAQRLVGAMGGSISLESELGVGSTFRFDVRMRRALEEMAEASSPTGSPVPAPSASFRVLIADDQPVNRMVLEHMLDAATTDCVMVENGVEAVEAATSERFDLVLMDVAMPVMDGVEATRAIRDHERAAGATPMPIIALTAHASPEHAAIFRAAGMDDHLVKPVNREALLEAVGRWTRGASAPDKLAG